MGQHYEAALCRAVLCEAALCRAAPRVEVKESEAEI